MLILESQKPTKYTFPRQSRCNRNIVPFLYVQNDRSNFTSHNADGTGIVIISKIVYAIEILFERQDFDVPVLYIMCI